jgi:thymidylate synthase (FAD)
VNECSARYSILPEEYYIPELEHILPQSEMNKQCRGGEISPEFAKDAQNLIRESSKRAYGNYQALLGDENDGVAREIARGVLPVNMYTEWYWKIDLHNLLHFIRLRIHPHAQYEIRVYAEILAKIVKEWCPLAYGAFEEHVLGGQTFSKSQMEVLKNLLSGVEIKGDGLSKRELEELKAVFDKE